MGNITEKLTQYDPKNYFLSYEILSGLPGMMKSGKNSWKLSSVSEHRTRVNMSGNIELKGFFGKLMKPMVKLQFNQMTKHLVEEFKYYVEKNEPHPRKLKATKKQAA